MERLDSGIRPETIVRAGDPFTSFLSAQTLIDSGNLGRQMLYVLLRLMDFIRKNHYCPTASELAAEYIESSDLPPAKAAHRSEMFHKTLPLLERKNVVSKVVDKEGQFVTRIVNGRKSVTWKVL